MDRKIILRFRNASKVGTSQELPVSKFPHIVIGRDASCEVAFDPDQDELVSRAHAKITVEGDSFWIGDMGSRNGTYVNTQRVSGRVKLIPGDIVQLGPGGPEFQFDVYPPPEGVPRATRLATDISSGQTPIAAPPALGGLSGKPPIEKATVERMIHEGQQHSRKNLYVAAAIAVVLLGTATVFLARACEATKPKSLTPSEISTRNLDVVVEVEFGWKLMDTRSGRQLNQLYIPNVRVVGRAIKNVREMREPIIPGGPDYLPLFVAADDGIEPLLTIETGGGHNRPIGEAGMRGSGFVVSSDGFILTNRHIAASWNSAYTFPDSKGVLLTSEGGKLVLKPIEAPGGWVPADAKALTHVDSPDPVKLGGIDQYPAGKSLEGRNDYLDVTFARNRIRAPAKLARVSDHIDVAMIKVDMPRPLRKCDLHDNYETIKPGDSITVMGYPVRFPDPSITTGNIARVTLTAYQLTITANGGAYSGGPVFDGQGRVVGLFSLEKCNHSAIQTIFAVPIRYGMELMGLTKEM